MLSRSNFLLLAVLCAQMVLLAISVISSSGTESRAVEPILSGMTAADIERISFH